MIAPELAASTTTRQHLPFGEVWTADFEFRAGVGERPWPVCMVAKELHSGREIRVWRNELLALRRAPFDVGPDSLFVAYYASAEFGCFLELGWPLPVNTVDLFAEHRAETNGLRLPCGNGLIGALAHRNLAHIDAGEKEAMRSLVCERAEWSEAEQQAILEYCASDVLALTALLPRMAPTRRRAREGGRIVLTGAPRCGEPVSIFGRGMARSGSPSRIGSPKSIRFWPSAGRGRSG